MRIKPNFLFVGASKTGSTSVYKYLQQHPDIFLSGVKEPLYFAQSEIRKINPIDPFFGDTNRYRRWDYLNATWDDYIELFKNVTTEKVIGEASQSYLYYYKTVIPLIKECLGDVRILIVLRNPVKKVISHYKFYRSQGFEPFNFEMALEKESERILERYNVFFHYTKQGFYYDSVKAYIDNFSKVKVLLYEDLVLDSSVFLNSILEFLDLDNNFAFVGNKKHNVSYIPKYTILSNLLCTDNVVTRIFKHCISYENRRLIKSRIKQVTNKNVRIKSSTRKMLQNKYEGDIRKLEGLLSINLTKWLE